MDNDRLKHSISVARKMVEIGRTYNLSDKELQGKTEELKKELENR